MGGNRIGTKPNGNYEETQALDWEFLITWMTLPETAQIPPAAREELYRMGLYNHGQIDALDTDSRRMLSRWFAGPRFGIDLTSAFNWLSSLQSVPQGDFGETYVNRPDYVDDLSEVNGIGPATERELNRIGVFQYRQIAGWSPRNR